MNNKKVILAACLALAFALSQKQILAATSNNDMLLLLPALLANGSRTHFLQADMAGAAQLYTLNAAIKSASPNGGDSRVFSYRLLGKEATRNTAVGAGNLLQVRTDGRSGLALTSSLGAVMALYTVTDPTAAYAYVALDPSDSDTWTLIERLGTGLVRVDLATNAVETVAPGCVVAPIADAYYANMPTGAKPIQFDGAGHVVFNGYRLENGTLSTKPGLKRVTLPARTVTALTDDSQSVQFFVAMENGDVVFQAQSAFETSGQLFLWQPAAGEISLTTGPVRSLLQDTSGKGIIYQETDSGSSTVTFARSRSGNGVERASLPKSTPWSVVGDDGIFYGLDSNSAGQVLVSTVLPYAATPVKTIAVDNLRALPWQATPPQISKGYLYFIARVDPGDYYGERDIINAQWLHGSNRITLFNDSRRYGIYAWRDTGGNDRLYFVARDKAASTATIVSGVIDTVKLRAGRPENEYLTTQVVASAVGTAAQVKDLEPLTPQVPQINPGYDPYIASTATSPYAEGLTFSKYMNVASVESGLRFTVKDGAAVTFLPVWFQSSLYLVPDRDGLLGNATTTPLDANVCYTVNLTGQIVDYWDTPFWDKTNVLPLAVGTACTAVPCSYTLNKTSVSFDAAGGSQPVAVTATSPSCAWVTQIPTTASWLAATAGGTGSGTATISAQANGTTTARSATMQVAGKSLTITQAGTPPVCAFSVDPMTLTEAAAGGTRTLTVTASPGGCTGADWTVANNPSWVHINDGASGTGSGTVGLTIDANTTTDSRTGTLQVAGKTVSITQSGLAGVDFVISDLFIKVGNSEYHDGDTISKNSIVHPYATVTNIGDVSTHPGFRIAYYINADRYRDSDGLDANELCAGCSKTEHVINDDIKLGETGTRTYRCCADYLNNVTETDESNNCKTMTFYVR